MATPKIALLVTKKQFSRLSSFAQTVITNMTGNLAFPTPVPTLALGTTVVNALNTAIAAWGPKGNRGTHADYVALTVAATNAYNWYKEEAFYVSSVAAGDITIITSSGYNLRNLPSPQPPLDAVSNLHQQLANSIDIHTPKLLWKKPANLLSPNNLKNYQVFRGTTNVFTDVTTIYIGQCSKAKYIDTSATPGTVYYYFIRPYSVHAPGPASLPLRVSVPL